MSDFEFSALTQRPVTKADNRFVRDLYCTSRDYEIKNVPWPQAQLTAFLKEQYALQKKHWDKTYPKADRKLILFQGQPIGRLYTDFDRQRKRLHLIDITLLREYRGFGIGAHMVRQLMSFADEKKAPLSLYVHSLNPAARLYFSLGFEQVSTKQEHLYLQYCDKG